MTAPWRLYLDVNVVNFVTLGDKHAQQTRNVNGDQMCRTQAVHEASGIQTGRACVRRHGPANRRRRGRRHRGVLFRLLLVLGDCKFDSERSDDQKFDFISTLAPGKKLSCLCCFCTCMRMSARDNFQSDGNHEYIAREGALSLRNR